MGYGVATGYYLPGDMVMTDHVSPCPPPPPQFSTLPPTVTFLSSKDPYLTSQYAIQFVKGMQFGNDLRYVLNYAWLAGTRGPNTRQYWFEL